MVTDAEGRILGVNTAFSRATGYAAPEVIGRNVSLLQSGRHDQRFYEKMWHTLLADGLWQGEIWDKHKDGAICPKRMTIQRVEDAEGRTGHYVAVFVDITSLVQAKERSEYLATRDALTGLANRILFHDHLQQALAEAWRAGTQIALFYIDLDNFKAINDALGHHMGDRVLVETARRLSFSVRESDTIARLGGDEFAAILLNCNPELARQISRRIIAELSAPIAIEGHDYAISASVGIALYPNDGLDGSALLRCADSALYRAKERGRNCVEFFTQELHADLLRRNTVEAALRHALSNNGLRLVFQPEYALANAPAFTRAETLLRWHDPELGTVSPAEFIPIAEACGLATQIDQHVQALLIDHIQAWRARSITIPTLTLNISPRSLYEAHFATAFLARFDEAGISHALLQVEITEGVIVDNSTTVLQNLEILRQAGIRITIDDFGIGFSCLSYMSRLPVSELKIDKIFIQGLGKIRANEVITRAILTLGHSLGLKIVAEGIETLQHLKWLCEWGCDFGQGFLLSRPLERADFEAFLTSQADGLWSYPKSDYQI